MSLPIVTLPQRWQIPDVIELEGDLLVYEYLSAGDRGGVAHVTPAYDEMLDRFYGLESGSDQDILEYAQDYGVLRLCKHGRPEGWEHPDDTAVCGPRPVDLRSNPNRFAEPLSVWRGWSRLMATLRAGASMIRAGQPFDAELMARLGVVTGYAVDSAAELRMKLGRAVEPGTQERLALASALDSMLGSAARVGVRYRPHAAQPDLYLKARGLADSLALQTVLTIASGRQSYICDGCGAVFVPTRQPRHGQRKFCDTCRANGVPKRLANRDMAARRRKETGK